MDRPARLGTSAGIFLLLVPLWGLVSGCAEWHQHLLQHHRGLDALHCHEEEAAAVVVAGHVRFPQELAIPASGLNLREAVLLAGGAQGDIVTSVGGAPVTESTAASATPAQPPIAVLGADVARELDEFEAAILSVQNPSLEVLNLERQFSGELATALATFNAAAGETIQGAVLTQKWNALRGRMVANNERTLELQAVRDEIAKLQQDVKREVAAKIDLGRASNPTQSSTPGTVEGTQTQRSLQIADDSQFFVSLSRIEGDAPVRYHYPLPAVMQDMPGQIQLVAGDRVLVVTFDETTLVDTLPDVTALVFGLVENPGEIAGAPLAESLQRVTLPDDLNPRRASAVLARPAPGDAGTDVFVLSLAPLAEQNNGANDLPPYLTVPTNGTVVEVVPTAWAPLVSPDQKKLIVVPADAAAAFLMATRPAARHVLHDYLERHCALAESNAERVHEGVRRASTPLLPYTAQ